MKTLASVQLDSALIKGIKDHCIRERDKGGYEAVGFLAARTARAPITVSAPLHNHCADPQKGYFVEPWEQYRTEVKLAESGYKIRGVYHSHPASEAYPSRADDAMARPGELMVIYSVAFDDLRCWCERDGQLEPVEIVDA